MNNEKLNENICILEKGITLQQFSEMQGQLEIDGSMDEYNEYGMYVVHNKTQNVYLIDGGNSPSAFPMSTSIPQFFLSHNGYGNPYMNQHYANGDEMILKFYRLDPRKYHNMGEMESALTKYYDSIAENYYDYVLRMNGRPIEKGQRKPGYNKYYNGAAKAPVINNSLPSKLLRLEHNHKKTYEFLNAVFDILIKSLPIFVWMLITNRDLFYGENVIQKGIMFITGIIAAFIGGILGYLLILFMVQLFKLFFCTYKKVNIHLRIFDIIIKLGKNKLYTSEDMDFLDEHEYNTLVRKDKVYDGKDRAYQRQQQRDEDALKYRKEQFELEKRDAEYYRDRAEAGYKDARKGDGFFTTAEEKRKNAGKDLDTANWHAQQASYEEQRIADLERKLGKWMRYKNMKLSEFLNLSNPIEYNFEFENTLIAESGFDTYARYFTYKADNENARKSGYENGKKFADDVFEKFGSIADCDGTLGSNENDTCMLTREVYRTLWGWNDVNNGKISRYGVSAIDSFGMVGPETMNSAQTIVNMIIKDSFEKCTDKSIVSLKRGRISANFMLELFSNECSKKNLQEWLDEISGLSSYLDCYHTLGNFVLVPAYFNPYRASVVDDFWDQSLSLLENKNTKWISNNNEITWDKNSFVRYINYFFLWDYTESYKPVILSKINHREELETFLEKTCEKIIRRGKFMLAMLKINEIKPDYYAELVDDIFNTNNQYANYKDVIEKIKTESCYLDLKVKEIIDLLEKELQ